MTTGPKYALMIGDGYGDAMASYGNAMHILEQYGGCPINMIHYGFNVGVETWLDMQSCVGRVIGVRPPDKATFQDVANEAGGYYGRPPSRWLPAMLEGTHIDPASVALTHVHWPWGAWPVHRAPMRLGDEANAWAERMRGELGEYILVQPYSTSSVGLAEHWYWWGLFLPWLIKQCEGVHKLVFCGLVPIPGLEGAHVVDMVGKCPSMMHMLALADRSQGVISTCNALANWTALSGTRGLIAGNQAIPRKDSFWWRFMSTKNNRVLPYTAKLEQMQAACERWLGKVGK